eukprot:Clim_evm53s152 gene=Clim_evmTU53s152
MGDRRNSGESRQRPIRRTRSVEFQSPSWHAEEYGSGGFSDIGLPPPAPTSYMLPPPANDSNDDVEIQHNVAARGVDHAERDFLGAVGRQSRDPSDIQHIELASGAGANFFSDMRATHVSFADIADNAHRGPRSDYRDDLEVLSDVFTANSIATARDSNFGGSQSQAVTDFYDPESVEEDVFSTTPRSRPGDSFMDMRTHYEPEESRYAGDLAIRQTHDRHGDRPGADLELAYKSRQQAAPLRKKRRNYQQPGGDSWTRTRRTSGPDSKIATSMAKFMRLHEGSEASLGRKEGGGLKGSKYSLWDAERQILSQTFQGIGNIDIDGFKTLAEGSGVFWYDLECPNELDMILCQEVFGLHPLTAEDVMDPDTREKLEFFDLYCYICLEGVIEEDESISAETTNLHIIVFEGCILTFHELPMACIQSTRTRLEANKVKRMTSDWIMYTLVDELIEDIIPRVTRATAEADAITDMVSILSETEQADILRRIGMARKQTAHLMRDLVPKRNVLLHIKNSFDIYNFSEITKTYLRDVLDDVLAMSQRLEYARDAVASAQANYLTKVSIHIAHSQYQADHLFKNLTVISTLVLPMQLLAGLFGMNVTVPFQTDKIDSLGPFFGIIGLMAFSMAALLYYFFRREMIEMGTLVEGARSLVSIRSTSKPSLQNGH